MNWCIAVSRIYKRTSPRLGRATWAGRAIGTRLRTDPHSSTAERKSLRVFVLLTGNGRSGNASDEGEEGVAVLDHTVTRIEPGSVLAAIQIETATTTVMTTVMTVKIDMV